jgi:hypothetical protein
MRILLANDTRGSVGGEHWGSWLTTTNLEKLLARAGHQVVDRLRLKELIAEEEIWRRIEKTDLLVINGEGSVHSATQTAVELLEAMKTAKERGIPVWMVNHGCWNCDSLLRSYDNASFLAVRDIASAGYLAQHGIAARLAADCSFLSPAAKGRQHNQLLVCSGLSAPPQRLIEHWAEGLSCTRIVFSNDFYPRFPAGSAVKSVSVKECFQLFATSRYVLSSSYHGCVFASIHGVPFLPVQAENQPPKTMVAAVESMGKHAWQIHSQGPGYMLTHYEAIRSRMLRRSQILNRRALRNVP